MPLLYSINGAVAPYEAAVAPVSPVKATSDAGFQSFLAGRLAQEGLELAQHLRESRSHQRRAVESYGEAVRPEHERRPVLRASQVMRAPVTCVSLDSPLAKADALMKAGSFRHLPVVADDGKLAGMLSDRDILRAGTALSEPVFSALSRQVLTATPDTTIRQIAEAMLLNRINALPLVDEEHRVVGILTTTDILRAVIARAPLELWV